MTTASPNRDSSPPSTDPSPPATTPILRRRWLYGLLGGGAALALVLAALIHTVPFLHMGWAAVTGSPDHGLIRDVREALLRQESVQAMLAGHEREALRRFRQSGKRAFQTRRTARIDLTPFGLPGFYDIFAFRVRTDIVPLESETRSARDTAYTSFLARPGVVMESNTEAFFTRQCDTDLCRSMTSALVRTVDAAMGAGLLTSYRLNVTETDRTSAVTFGWDPLPRSVWARETRRLHQQGQGRSFR